MIVGLREYMQILEQQPIDNIYKCPITTLLLVLQRNMAHWSLVGNDHSIIPAGFGKMSGSLRRRLKLSKTAQMAYSRARRKTREIILDVLLFLAQLAGYKNPD